MSIDIADLFDGSAAAPTADRRITNRLMESWARADRDRFPSWASLQNHDLGDDWNWIFVVDLARSVGFPCFTFLGDKLAKLSDVYLSGSEDWTVSLLEKVTNDVFDAAAVEGPLDRDDVLTLCDGRRLLVRAVTLPLADDGQIISHAIGAVNGRFATNAKARLVAIK
ncbi:MAG: hypothetical protein HKN14_10830 [Marinicaulis sp.]|nr:hypothetical protein [Marinicaulis sp.]NNE41395.1 hypothetical protein [Marinicaulis sp.]NNL89437.1 hypothetical protein [Marinicaulis sp.]